MSLYDITHVCTAFITGRNKVTAVSQCIQSQCVHYVQSVSQCIQSQCVHYIVDIHVHGMPQKIINPPPPVLKAGHLVSCSCVHTCMSCISVSEVGFHLKSFG